MAIDNVSFSVLKRLSSFIFTLNNKRHTIDVHLMNLSKENIYQGFASYGTKRSKLNTILIVNTQYNFKKHTFYM